MNSKAEVNKIILALREQFRYMSEIGAISEIRQEIEIGSESSINARISVPKSGDKASEVFAKSAPIPNIEEIKAKPTQSPNDPLVRRSSLLEKSRLKSITDRSRIELSESEREIKQRDRAEQVMEKPMANESIKESKSEVQNEKSLELPASEETLADIHMSIGSDCKLCDLCENRTQIVNSIGNPNAELMFIGEAPGADEDEKGEPFVGRAGKLLTKIIEAIDLSREEVFIGNINRCRPPGNRNPTQAEATVCKPFLLREIKVVRPKVIVVMGNIACQNLLDTKIGITKLRGAFQDYFGVKVMPTFHPAYLLRDPRKKREVWEDMKTVRAFLDQS